MGKEAGFSQQPSSLRGRVEAAIPTSGIDTGKMSAESVQQLVHELQVRQVQLELQNQELRQTQLEVEESRRRYRGLYDSAPVSYLTLDLHGVILEANLTAVSLLVASVERTQLIGRNLSSFLVLDDSDILSRHLQQVCATGAKQICDLRIVKPGGSPVDVQLESIAADGGDENKCQTALTTLTDITDRKRTEAQIRELSRAVEQSPASVVMTDVDGLITHFLAVKEDITERKRLEEQLRYLASQLSLTEERERRRLAADLHDRISQTLAVCKMKLGAARAAAASSELASLLAELAGLMQQTIWETRSLTFELCPPVLYELGLEAAVEWLGEQIQARHGLPVWLEDDGQPKPVADDVQFALFRVVSELLTNIVKHAGAHSAKVSIRKVENQIQIKVEDDGCGFDPSQATSPGKEDGGFGLFSIRQRLDVLGGSFTIDTKLGGGTRVMLAAPLKPRARGQESGVRSQGSGVRGQGSGVRGQESGVRGQESGIKKPLIPDP